ncbi:hypothetical protein KA005_53210 [bacterium]|nr:hypothetical protein [bacterium]
MKYTVAWIVWLSLSVWVKSSGSAEAFWVCLVVANIYIAASWVADEIKESAQ